MTEKVFSAEMNRTENGFDIYAPENMTPLVVWLVSNESAAVTGQVFELKGGKLSLSEGWTDGPAEDKGARWNPEELGLVIARLLAQRAPVKPVYGTS